MWEARSCALHSTIDSIRAWGTSLWRDFVERRDRSIIDSESLRCYFPEDGSVLFTEILGQCWSIPKPAIAFDNGYSQSVRPSRRLPSQWPDSLARCVQNLFRAVQNNDRKTILVEARHWDFFLGGSFEIKEGFASPPETVLHMHQRLEIRRVSYEVILISTADPYQCPSINCQSASDL